MTDAEIRNEVLARDALRREAGLPPLDVEREVRHAGEVAAAAAEGERRAALREAHAAEYEAIRNAVIGEMRAGGNTGFPNGWGGHYYLHTLVEKRFAQFLAGRA